MRANEARCFVLIGSRREVGIRNLEHHAGDPILRPACKRGVQVAPRGRALEPDQRIVFSLQQPAECRALDVGLLQVP